MRFYIAGGASNTENINEIIKILSEAGHDLTFDSLQSFSNTEFDMCETSFSIVRAVRDAELVILLLPETKALCTELGIALASKSNKRIVVWSETGNEFSGDTFSSFFYYHTAIERLVCSREELLDFMSKI